MKLLKYFPFPWSKSCLLTHENFPASGEVHMKSGVHDFANSEASDVSSMFFSLCLQPSAAPQSPG